MFTDGFLKKKNIINNKSGLSAGCKESQFYSLPFGWAVASMYQPESHFNQPEKDFMSRIDYSSSVFEVPQKNHLPIGQVKNRIHLARQQNPLARDYQTPLALHTDLTLLRLWFILNNVARINALGICYFYPDLRMQISCSKVVVPALYKSLFSLYTSHQPSFRSLL